MKSERMFCVLALVGAMTILLLGLFGASEALAAGGGVSSPGMSDWLDFPDARLGGNYTNYPGSDEANGWTSFTLKNHTLDNAGWNIYVDKFDTSHFYANFTASGMLLGENEKLAPFETMRQETNFRTRAGVSLYESIETGYGSYVETEFDVTQNYVYLNGNMRLSPARISRLNLYYGEYPDYDWDPKTGDMFPTEDTRWSAQCTFDGYFLAVTPLEARAMGAQFASVPEPSALALLLSSGIAGLALSIRRRWN